jgi:hypothetical protein
MYPLLLAARSGLQVCYCILLLPDEYRQPNNFKENTLSQPIKWTEDNIAKLMQCDTLDQLLATFPGHNVETLRRRQRQFRAGDDLNLMSSAEEPEVGSISLTGDSGIIKTGAVAEPITDWTDTIKLWGLDPQVFEVIQPVTMKAWGKPGEFRYSYAARIQKKAEAEPELGEAFDIQGWRDTLKSYVNYPSRTVRTDGLSYLILVADPQLGKPGTQTALSNWTKGIDGHMQRIRNLIDSGLPVNEIALAFMGDEHEGAVGNYASQPYEVEMNYSDQIELDFDMRVWTIRQLLEAQLPIKISSVPSNHGEHTRFGSAKAVTSIYDNSSTMVAKLTKRVFDGTPAEDALTWYIAEDRQDTNLSLSGVKANFTHGHVSNGSGSKTGGLSSKNAIEKQILGRREELTDTDLFFTAHYHHFSAIEDRGRSFFLCPALEDETSSKWFFDSAGVWSRAGMLGMTVGRAAGPRGWDELAVI